MRQKQKNSCDSLVGWTYAMQNVYTSLQFHAMFFVCVVIVVALVHCEDDGFTPFTTICSSTMCISYLTHCIPSRSLQWYAQCTVHIIIKVHSSPNDSNGSTSIVPIHISNVEKRREKIVRRSVVAARSHFFPFYRENAFTFTTNRLFNAL